MYAEVIIGDIRCTIINMSAEVAGSDKGRHSVVLMDEISKAFQPLTLDSEAEAITFLQEFLIPEGPPEGGIYFDKVTVPEFLP